MTMKSASNVLEDKITFRPNTNGYDDSGEMYSSLIACKQKHHPNKSIAKNRNRVKIKRILWETLDVFIGRVLLLKELLRRQQIKFFYKFICRNSSLRTHQVKIVIAEWGGYSLRRIKRHESGNEFLCGLREILNSMAKRVAGLKYEVILVVNDASEEKKLVYCNLASEYWFIEKVIFRNNTGRDFGAYQAAYSYLQNCGYTDDIVFMNTGVVGPEYDFWLLRYSQMFHRRLDIGLCGISMNSSSTHLGLKDFKPHVQSFFVYTTMHIVNRIFNGRIPGSDVGPDDKLTLITEGEIGLSQRVLACGLGICSKIYENKVYYKKNDWQFSRKDIRDLIKYKYFINRI